MTRQQPAPSASGPATAAARPRVLIVSHYAGERAGGEGSIPLRLLGRLRARGIEAWLLTHESKRAELAEVLPAGLLERVRFTGGLPGFGLIYRLGKRLPPGPRTMAWGVTQLERQLAMLPVVRGLVRELAIDVVHQPISVSPVIPSALRRVGVPVVMGPLNGGTGLPPAFTGRDSRLYALIKAARPAAGGVLNRLIRGRLSAAAVLVANERTRALLPGPVRPRARTLSDIGVVPADWPPGPPGPPGRAPGAGPARFLFTGRLVDWKGVDLLLDAFAGAALTVPAELDIIGDGPARQRLAAQAQRLPGQPLVRFHGWLDPADCAAMMRGCHVYVTAALQESGGISVLEAMSSARPVIATAWGGHLDTLDESAGILVGVSSRAAVVRGLADAMISLAGDPDRRARLGAAGRQRVEQHYDWDGLTGQLLRVYAAVTGAGTGTRPAAAR
ncbi:MAG TPA: glycosyltransferase family 4 protein [Streptosporangiaceae bacterium]|jgi:glycosyltransferase involved in cell wall biosynthesis